jgi:ATP-dependent DNA helicase RecQ
MSVESAQMVDLKAALEQYFGYTSFRGPQEEIIRTLLLGRHVMVIMPTGAGKSLCYQLPALLMPGTALIVSPLIALMKNQVDQMHAYDIPAAYLNSSLSRSQQEEVRQACLDGRIKLLYVAPETLATDSFQELLRQLTISFVAIDEAHCISEWGHDFRPEYRRIRSLLREVPAMPLIALTATATPRVQADILENLEIQDAVVFRTTFNRPNLYYQVTAKRSQQHTLKEIVQYVRARRGESGIIYCHSRKRVEEVAKTLQANGLKALPYHAGMDTASRSHNQDAFLNEEVQVIVATIAFGMGIDKPDVRYVIHYDVPKSIENYYQETGRAGRDGLPADCILYYDYNDILKLDRFLRDKPASEREAIVFLLQEMAYFCESGQCRRKMLLRYFGETYPHDQCGNCDNCRYPKTSFNGREIVHTILESFACIGKYPLLPILEHVRGSVNEVAERTLPTYAKLKAHSIDELKAYAAQILMEGLLARDPQDYSLIYLSEKGQDWLTHPEQIALYKPHDRAPREDDDFALEDEDLHDPVLLDMLKALRKKIADERRVPPYVIFQEPTLVEMATRYPITLEEIEKISGVGPIKTKKFGKAFVELIRKYVEDNDIERPPELIVPTQNRRTPDWVEIIESTDRRIPLRRIAERLSLSVSELIERLEMLIFKGGVQLNLTYAVQEMMDPDRLDEAFDYFMTAESDDLEEAIRVLGQDLTEEEIRLVRLYFHQQALASIR